MTLLHRGNIQQAIIRLRFYETVRTFVPRSRHARLEILAGFFKSGRARRYDEELVRRCCTINPDNEIGRGARERSQAWYD